MFKQFGKRNRLKLKLKKLDEEKNLLEIEKEILKKRREVHAKKKELRREELKDEEI
jgi:hypothetical protein